MVKFAIGETGICRRAQTDLAKRLGIHARTVQRGLDHLVAHKYLKPVGQAARKGFVQAYQVFRPEEVTPAPYLKPEPAPPGEHTTLVSPHTTPASESYGAPTVHVPLKDPVLFPSADRETEPGGPRQRADALGPPRQTGKRLGNGLDAAAAEPTRDPSLDGFQERLCKLIGHDDHAGWFANGKADAVSLTDGTLKLEAKSAFIAQRIENWFAPQVLAAAGATRLDVVVQAEPSTARAAP
jgi:hypothetical protein